MPNQIALPGGFVGGQLARRAFDQSMESADIEQAGGKLDNEKKAFDLRLAHKAVAAQEAVVAAVAKIPDIGEQLQGDPATAMAKIAGVMLDNGQVGAATELLGKSATAGKESALAAKAHTETTIKRAEHVGSAFAGVTDELGWKAAVAGLMANYPEEKEALEQLAMLPHNAMESRGYFDYAKVAKGLSDSALTEVQRAQRDQAAAASQYSRQLAAESAARTKILIPAQAEAQKARARNLEKSGGKTTSKLTVTDAKRMIMSDYAVNADEANVLAIEVADKATELVKENNNLTRADALKQAYRDAKKNSDLFAGLTPKISRAGSRPENPLDFPFQPGDEGDPAKLQTNKYYNVPGRSQPYLWNGKEFVLPQAFQSADIEEEEPIPDDEGEEGEE